jgi:hypothetical protein
MRPAISLTRANPTTKVPEKLEVITDGSMMRMRKR